LSQLSARRSHLLKKLERCAALLDELRGGAWSYKCKRSNYTLVSVTAAHKTCELSIQRGGVRIQLHRQAGKVKLELVGKTS
jgi:hypothetical protein